MTSKKFGESTEEMLDITIGRIEYVMDHIRPKEALKTEVYNLIDAAIMLLNTNTEDMDPGKVAAYWEKLQCWAKDLYIEQLMARDGKIAIGQFHLSGELMRMICMCKTAREGMEEAIKEADAEEPRQLKKKRLVVKNGRPILE